MRKIISIIVFCLTLTPLFAQELGLTYEISRKEWLEYEVFKTIKTETDAWNTRIAFRAGVYFENDEYYLDLVLTTANGERQLSNAQMQNYIDHVTRIIQRILDQYEWATDIEVRVTFV